MFFLLPCERQMLSTKNKMTFAIKYPYNYKVFSGFVNKRWLDSCTLDSNDSLCYYEQAFVACVSVTQEPDYIASNPLEEVTI
jgi:hypothetical protein